jgi:hypothetical protein
MLLGIVILVLIIWFLPYWQVPVSGLSLKDRLHQINEYRRTLAQIVGGIAGGFLALIGLYIAWVRSKALRDQAEVAREQQLTDLYVKAVEQLGSENLQIRLGGIYALERIARESPKDHWPIMEVLTAFVRENAPLREETPEIEPAKEESSAAPDTEEIAEPKYHAPRMKLPTDIQAVLTVLGRTAIAYAQKGETRSLDLRATDLAFAVLRKANLQRVLLQRSNLQLSFLIGADLQGARLSSANLQGAILGEANIQEADLSYANLRGANLRYSNLKGAKLLATKLEGAMLGEADLRMVDLRSIKGAPEQVETAICDETTQWPEGFSPPPRRPPDEEKE